jgi:hypothetical protein
LLRRARCFFVVAPGVFFSYFHNMPACRGLEISTVSKFNALADKTDPAVRAIRKCQQNPDPQGLKKLLAGSEKEVDLSKITKSKFKAALRAKADADDSEDQDSDEIHQLGEQTDPDSPNFAARRAALRRQKKSGKGVIGNGHHGGRRAANPVEEPDKDPVEHVKGLGIGPSTADELTLFKGIRQQGRELYSSEFVRKRF